MSKPNTKLSVCFVVPVDASDTKAVKEAYKDIGSQILKFAEAIKADKNVLISHSVISADPADMKPCAHNPADAKIAELQTIGKKIDKGMSALDKPKQPITELPDDTEEEDQTKPTPVQPSSPKPTAKPITKPVLKPEETPARIVKASERVSSVPTNVGALVIDNATGKSSILTVDGKTKEIETKAAPVTAAAPSENTDDAPIVKALLSRYERVTAKSTAIIKFLVANKDKELTVGEISAGSGQSNIALGAWLTASAPKELENVKRGVYRLNSSKVKV